VRTNHNCLPARQLVWRIVGPLDGKVAVVTGGGGGIGGATARALAKEGASVAVVDIEGSRGERVAGGIVASDGNAFSVAADLSEESDVVEAIKATISLWTPRRAPQQRRVD